LNRSGTLFEIPKYQELRAKIEGDMARPDFWNNQETAQATIQRLKQAKSAVEPFLVLVAELRDFSELLELAIAEKDTGVLEKLSTDIVRLEHQVEHFELEYLLSGDDDKRNCFISIHAGTGGTDACDWAEMLLRMYSRWLEKNGFELRLIDSLSGDEAGIRHSTFSVTGRYAFGFMKSEMGVHRLVRISPYDANKRRHTAFASVDVMPEFDEEKIEIADKDIRVDTYRASGPGGQHLNVTDSAVRITHLLTGIIVQCQSERSQHANRRTAMRMLAAKLYQIKLREREEDLKRAYGEKGEIAWGNQIRSYVLQPYTLVKDHRT
jgi:peptide chain release factor 2